MLRFISITDQTGRTSSLGLSSKTPHVLNVVGELPHNSYIQPKTVADAEALITFLQQWIDHQKQQTGKPE